MKKSIMTVAIMVLALVAACNGDKNVTLEQKLLNNEQVEYVNFTIAGSATCQKCSDDEVPIAAMQIELYPKQGSLESLSLKIYEGLGPFTIDNIKGVPGQIFEVHGRLLREGTSGLVTAYYGYAEVAAPDENDEAVAVSLKFPSSDTE